MSFVVIPLKPLPNQALSVVLNNQACQINVYQKRYGLFLDLLVNNAVIVAGVICQNYNRIVRSAYLGFSGDLCFFDNQGTSDPVYTGLGSRFSLIYIFPDQVPELSP